MFVVIYEFVVKQGDEQQFISAWSKTTQGIYLFKNSLGSRLHRDKRGVFIAYAQWPDEATYRNAVNIEMSADYEQQREQMRNSLHLEATKVVYEMEVNVDYLQQQPIAL
ncbi:antibiotic biosynthesis monooxygenase [Thalassotalea ponticola]|uniref:antibiotic biosynthesis monooxygenase n=1 Tax=Thalassotalea ponticola TaxID=1523392 RepID=UPI0025B2EA43|nr:antibiotic biosynthesis monooxygenase [Thalassotalea ponticola]MDN3652050.1 antibiotic biosynthesis monooxygenase [Thalassotalea ponticola]